MGFTGDGLGSWSKNGYSVRCIKTPNEPLLHTSLSCFLLDCCWAGARLCAYRRLLAWYPFNGNANDESGSDLHALPQAVDLVEG